ncbi:MAG: LCP family protein [Actinobacteria bacterium]|nr:LCP family protein [Actinomycetota bacterium]
MSALASVRRRRTLVMLAINLVVLLGVGALLYAGALALSRYEGAKDASVTMVKVPSTPVAMLASVDGDDALSSVTVMVLKANALVGGSIVSVPISSDTAGGVDGQRIPLTEVYATGGAEALTLAVESILSVTVDQSYVANPDQLAAVLQPVAPITVDLPIEVNTNPNSSSSTVYPAGEVALSGKQAASVINARVEDQTEADRRPTLEAVWAGVAAAIGDGVTDVPAPVIPGSFELFITQLYGGPAQSRGLPAGPLPAGDVPEGKDVEELDRPEAVMVFATIAPSNMSAANPGLMFRIEAPPGSEAKVKFVVKALLYLGANVQQVYLNGPTQDATVIYLYDDRFQDDVLGAEALFGKPIETATPEVRIEGIDVVIQLGSVYLGNTESPDTLPSTTTTTTVP